MRTALKPRWLALLVVMLLAASVMAKLGDWQLQRAREHGDSAQKAEQAAESGASVPIGEVLRPSQTFQREAINAKVSATGHWSGADQLLVPDRELDGEPGLWVLTPLITEDGTTVPVVRGWVADAAEATEPDSDTEVTVVGLVQPTEPSAVRDPGETSGLPEGQIDRVAAAQLAGLWPQPMVTGFVVMSSQTPQTDPALTLVPPPTSDGKLDWGNVSYAIQWWAFALIALLFWFRLVRDDHKGLLRRDLEEEDDDEDEAAPAVSHS
nr:SURF1 family protein [Kineosporia babensis]